MPSKEIRRDQDMFRSARESLGRHFPDEETIIVSTTPDSTCIHLVLVGVIPDHWFSRYNKLSVACYAVMHSECVCELVELCNVLNQPSFPNDLYVTKAKSKSSGTSLTP